MTHLFQRMEAVERMSYTAIDLLENFILYKDGTKDKFTKFLEKAHKEALKNEKDNVRQKDQPAAKANKEDARQRAERIRSKKR